MLSAWKACEALAATIPKESAARHVTPLKEALAGAKEKERRKRRGGPLHLKGLVLPPKALAPFVPIYLQGVLQVCVAVVVAGGGKGCRLRSGVKGSGGHALMSRLDTPYMAQPSSPASQN